MSQNYPSIISALGSVVSGGAQLWSAGATAVNGGAGITALTLDEAADAGACAILCTLRAGAAPAADVTFQVVHTSDTVKTVNCFEAGVATNRAFDFMVLRAPLS